MESSYKLLPQQCELCDSEHEVVDGSRGSDVVQFGLPVSVVKADTAFAEIPIMRIGDQTGSCSFKYTTVECSAKAGVQFVPQEGRIEMAPGVGEKTIKIEMVNDPKWNATLEFQVHLTDPVGCILGLYLKVMRVKVIDATTFPTNAFKEEMAKVLSGEKKLSSIDEFALFRGFLLLMSKQSGVWWRTLITIFFDMCKNAYVYMGLVLGVYMVDTVFNFNTHSGLLIPGNRLGTAYAVAILILLPVIIFWAFDTVVIKLDIKGILRGSLGRSLFRKFMNYTRTSWDSVPSPDKVAAITTDTNELTDSYLRVVSMIRLLGKIIVSILFTLRHNPDVWWAVAAVPTIMAIWVLCRHTSFARASSAHSKCDCDRTDFVEEVLGKMRLVAQYAQRPQINTIFSEKTDDLMAVQVPEAQAVLNNMFLARLMGPVLVAGYTAVGANLVLNNKLELGVYLATIGVFGDICNSFAELFGYAMDIVQRFDTLRTITNLLNKPTELPALMQANSEKATLTPEKCEQLPKSTVPRVDRLPIEIVNVSFQYKGTSEPIFTGVNLRCEQGVIVAIRGRPGSGRKTIAELLSGGLHPNSGVVFVPSHLRVLHVSREVVILNLSVWQNLVFGNLLGNNPYRIEKILESLKLDSVKQMCEEDLLRRKREFDGRGGAQEEQAEKHENSQRHYSMSVLRDTEQSLIHLARAFVMNPEVMVLHRPFMHYHNDKALVDTIKKAFFEQVWNHGWLMPPESKLSRRPRTLFFSCDDEAIEDALADVVWDLDAPEDQDNCLNDVGHTHHRISQYKVAERIGSRKISGRTENCKQAEVCNNTQNWQPDWLVGPPTPIVGSKQTLEPNLLQGPCHGFTEASLRGSKLPMPTVSLSDLINEIVLTSRSERTNSQAQAQPSQPYANREGPAFPGSRIQENSSQPLRRDIVTQTGVKRWEI